MMTNFKLTLETLITVEKDVLEYNEYSLERTENEIVVQVLDAIINSCEKRIDGYQAALDRLDK